MAAAKSQTKKTSTYKVLTKRVKDTATEASVAQTTTQQPTQSDQSLMSGQLMDAFIKLREGVTKPNPKPSPITKRRFASRFVDDGITLRDISETILCYV
jgi:hypothetical protein